jgi:dynein heavy chain
MLADTKLVEKLKNYDKDNIPKKVTECIDNYVKSKPNYKPEIIEKATKAGGNLAKWCLATLDYAKVVDQAEPKRKAVAESKAKLKAA